MPKAKKTIGAGGCCTTGAKKDKYDKRDFRLAGIMASVTVPKQKFALKEEFAPNNQGVRPSCTSQAQVHHKERQEKLNCSARFVMALAKKLEGNTGWGAYTRTPFVVVNKYGVCQESLYPEPGQEMGWEEYIDSSKIPSKCFTEATSHKSKTYWRIDNSIDSIRQSLVQNKNSVVIAIDWYRAFNNPSSDGTLSTVFGGDKEGHAVEVCGFDDIEEKLICKNSWGNGWGNNGFFKIPYSIFSSIIMDCWTSLDIPADMPVDNRYEEKRTYATFLKERATAFNIGIKIKLGRLPNNREINALVYGFWSFDAVFMGKVGDIWLKLTKPEAIKRKLIDKNENKLIK